MSINIKKAASAALMAAAALTASAQDTQSGYFVEDFTYRYLLNPAMDNSKGFVAIPAIGNIGFNLRGNTSLTDVLYNVDGRTTTFMNPGVSASEAMSNFSDNNRIGFDTRINILAAGFKAFHGYNTVTIGARASAHANIPKSIFSFLKEGISNQDYDLSGMGATGMAYAEIALGHSHRITDEWRVGANVKFLVGIAGMDLDLTTAHLSLMENSWNVTTNARIHASIKGMQYKMDHNSHTGLDYVDGLDGSFSAPNGFGMGFDLGAVYTPKMLPDWQFSLAVNDLGFINWQNDILASTNGDKTFRTDAYTFNPDDNAPNSFKNEWKEMRNQLESIYQLESDGNVGNHMQPLNATFHVGARYTLPYYRPLKFGLLNTTRIAGKFTWTDFRLSANVAPCKVFSAGVNLSAGNLGCGFGWIANLHAPGFNLFLAQDHTFSKLAKQGIPLSRNASFTLGMNVLLSK
ncbi:MAG: hypothetical protein K2K49_00600 [Duncaniella sp.]|nr:hypothetical protein [Duncaniella sp.]